MSRMVPHIFFVDATMRKDSASHDADDDDKRSNDGENLTEEIEKEEEEHLKNDPDDDRNQTIKNLELQVVHRNETIKNLEFQVVHQNETIKNLKLQVVQKDNDIENLKMKVQQLEIAQQQHMEAISKIDLKCDERQQTIENLQGQLKVKEEQLLESRNESGSKQLTEIYENEKALYQQRIAVQDKEIVDLKQKTERTEEEKKTCLQRLNVLEAENATLKKGIGSHEAVKSKMENDNNALKLSLQNATQEVESMKTLLQEEKKLRQENNDKCVVFEQQIASNAEKAKKDLELIKQLQDMQARINNENAATKQQLALAQAQVDKEKEECQQKEQTIKALQLDIAQKDQTISLHASNNNDVVKVREDLAQVKNLYEKQLADNEKIKNESLNLTSQLQDIREKLDSEKEKCIQKEESIKQLTSNIATSEQRLQQLTSSNDKFKHEIATLKSDIATVQEQKDDVQKESDNVKKVLLEKTTELDQLAEQFKNMQSGVVDDARTTADAHKKEKKEWLLANDQLTDKVTRQEVELQRNRDQIQSLKEQIESLKEQIERDAIKSAGIERELEKAIKDNLHEDSEHNQKMQKERDTMNDLKTKLLAAVVAHSANTRKATLSAPKQEKNKETLVNAFKELLIVSNTLKQIPTTFDAVSLEGLKQALRKEYTHGPDVRLWNEAEPEIDQLIKSNESKKASKVEEIVSEDSSSVDPSSSKEPSPPTSTETRSPKQSKRLQNPAGLALQGSSKQLQEKLQASNGRQGQPVGKKQTDNKSGHQSKAAGQPVGNKQTDNKSGDQGSRGIRHKMYIWKCPPPHPNPTCDWKRPSTVFYHDPFEQ